jgi:hypothetical protein
MSVVIVKRDGEKYRIMDGKVSRWSGGDYGYWRPVIRDLKTEILKGKNEISNEARAAEPAGAQLQVSCS